MECLLGQWELEVTPQQADVLSIIIPTIYGTPFCGPSIVDG
jgi:hypothetical protein